jgi:hypothetical protein
MPARARTFKCSFSSQHRTQPEHPAPISSMKMWHCMDTTHSTGAIRQEVEVDAAKKTDQQVSVLKPGDVGYRKT